MKNKHEFEKWLDGQGISLDDDRVPLLKAAWNQALKLACDHYGFDDGAEEALGVE